MEPTQGGAVLTRYDIQEMLKISPPLIEELIDEEQQLQQNGIDLTVKTVAMMSSQGRMGTDKSERIISQTAPLAFDGLGYLELITGFYLITFNEIVHLPRDIMALAKPRSSLLRCGVSIENAVWDAGYEGRSQALLVIHNHYGYRLKKNARVLQMVFFRLTGETTAYDGIFQRENT
ncbi:MAG: deoxyuridine 5'-triphosphate nucleotidohydrolase [Dehalococcoidia bacterium]|nr:deoxyuridine 5'-triphosphate nucleotidohydrolase [Dehalococcoidia bacterium]